MAYCSNTEGAQKSGESVNPSLGNLFDMYCIPYIIEYLTDKDYISCHLIWEAPVLVEEGVRSYGIPKPKKIEIFYNSGICEMPDVTDMGSVFTESSLIQVKYKSNKKEAVRLIVAYSKKQNLFWSNRKRVIEFLPDGSTVDEKNFIPNSSCDWADDEDVEVQGDQQLGLHAMKLFKTGEYKIEVEKDVAMPVEESFEDQAVNLLDIDIDKEPVIFDE